jgi:hypothetical protein
MKFQILVLPYKDNRVRLVIQVVLAQAIGQRVKDDQAEAPLDRLRALNQNGSNRCFNSSSQDS